MAVITAAVAAVDEEEEASPGPVLVRHEAVEVHHSMPCRCEASAAEEISPQPVPVQREAVEVHHSIRCQPEASGEDE